jgi:hypothetical protein
MPAPQSGGTLSGYRLEYQLSQWGLTLLGTNSIDYDYNHLRPVEFTIRGHPVPVSNSASAAVDTGQ